MDTRPYPNWWIEKASLRKRLLDLDVERLGSVVPDLPRTREVIVFGSYARNEVGPESDLDIMIVQECNEPLGSRGAELRHRLDLVLELPYDLIVSTPEAFERLRLQWPFVMTACREGIHVTNEGV